jgi:hypothetical protein
MFNERTDDMLTLFIGLGAALVAALVVVPVIEEADAGCDGFVKKNGKICRPKNNPH